MNSIFKRYPRIAARAFGVPIIMEPRRLDALLHGLLAYADGAPTATATIVMNDGKVDREATTIVATGGASAGDKPYALVDGVAVIDVQGALVHHAGQIDADCMEITSYESLAATFAMAVEDPSATSILLIVDSPGGEVSGAFDFADQIFEARGKKEVVAIAADLAASAGYLIASSASKLYVTQTAIAGSIGVVMTHVDVSGAAEKQGLKFTHIHAGARKVDGSPYKPLEGDAKDAVQGEIDATYAIFVNKVARNRGISADSIRSTEAGVFVGAAAVERGLADGVTTASRLVADLGTSSRRSPTVRALFAADPTPPASDPVAASQENPMKTPAELEAENNELKAKLAAADVKAENELAAKRTEVLARHAKRLSPATMKKMTASLDAIADPVKVDAILSGLPDDVSPVADGDGSNPAPKTEGGETVKDPEGEVLKRAASLRKENSDLSQRNAINTVLESDPALAKAVKTQRESYSIPAAPKR